MGSKRARPSPHLTLPYLRQPVGIPPGTPIRPLTNVGRSSFGFELSRALGTAKNAGRLSEATDAAIRERMIWLRIKRESLSVVARRIAEEWGAVRGKALKSDPAEAGYTLNVGRTEAVTLTADLEALVIGLRATLDGLVRLVHVVEREVIKGPETPEDQVWSLPGVEPAERELLRQARHAFAHGQAAWPEVLLPPDHEPELLIAARLRPDYVAGEGYVLLSQVARWWAALDRHADAMETSLASRVNALC